MNATKASNLIIFQTIEIQNQPDLRAAKQQTAIVTGKTIESILR